MRPFDIQDIRYVCRRCLCEVPPRKDHRCVWAIMRGLSDDYGCRRQRSQVSLAAREAVHKSEERQP